MRDKFKLMIFMAFGSITSTLKIENKLYQTVFLTRLHVAPENI